MTVISFDPLWKTMKEKNISTYKLLNVYGFSHGTYDSLKQNRNATLQTLNQLCKILQCKVEDVVVYVEDKD